VEALEAHEVAADPFDDPAHAGLRRHDDVQALRGASGPWYSALLSPEPARRVESAGGPGTCASCAPVSTGLFQNSPLSLPFSHEHVGVGVGAGLGLGKGWEKEQVMNRSPARSRVGLGS
jgi:hypothetical protein